MNISNSTISISNGGIISGGSGNGSSPTSLKSSYDGGELSFNLAPVVLNPDIASVPHSQVKRFARKIIGQGIASI